MEAMLAGCSPKTVAASKFLKCDRDKTYMKPYRLFGMRVYTDKPTDGKIIAIERIDEISPDRDKEARKNSVGKPVEIEILHITSDSSENVKYRGYWIS